jgi:lathosterol oxidase
MEIAPLNHSFGFYGVAFFGIILMRYFLVAGGTHLFLYVTSREGRPNFNGRRSPSLKSILGDIQLSVLSALIFALCAAVVMSAYQLGLTQLYIEMYSSHLWYLGVSYGAVLILQDTYFYFVHRLVHHPALYRWLHQGHHRSPTPTPWTSFAFDPLESIIQALFLVGITFIIPLHLVTLIAVLTTMTVWSVVNHLGVDRLPASFPHHWFGKWCIGPAHHAIHHRKYRVHYGLYFTFWDRLLGSQDPDYDATLQLPKS